jgi:diguanylate cyclase (GGDEF)-like protein
MQQVMDRLDPGARGPETLFDPETGLLDGRVFVVCLERKVAAARRHLRPLTVVLLDVSTGLAPGGAQRLEQLVAFARLLHTTLRDADVACRVGPVSFGLILEDTPEQGGVLAVERLQAAALAHGGPCVIGSVASYPNHGLAAGEVLQRGRDALGRARQSQLGWLGGVHVASPAPDTPA